MAMSDKLIAQFPPLIRSALATQKCEGFEPAFELTVEEAEQMAEAAEKEALAELKEFRRTGTFEPGPAYVKTPH